MKLWCMSANACSVWMAMSEDGSVGERDSGTLKTKSLCLFWMTSMSSPSLSLFRMEERLAMDECFLTSRVLGK